jgi:hypothetical protein
MFEASALAEGEELGSNILHVVQRSQTKGERMHAHTRLTPVGTFGVTGFR